MRRGAPLAAHAPFDEQPKNRIEVERIERMRPPTQLRRQVQKLAYFTTLRKIWYLTLCPDDFLHEVACLRQLLLKGYSHAFALALLCLLPLSVENTAAGPAQPAQKPTPTYGPSVVQKANRYHVLRDCRA